MKNATSQIPSQKTGNATDFIHEEAFNDIPSAHRAFKRAVERLLTINNWHEYAGAGSAKFTLCNNLGDELTGFAAEGLYFSIDLPVPGPDAGDGLEWVMIEVIKTQGDTHTAEEFVTMTVRPAPDPRKADLSIAHFYTDASTSTFMVRRDGRVVTAGAHGRNETANNNGVDLHDKIRNTAVALLARIGLSGVQWQKLVNGLIC
ncbi:MAG: hypothetical protein NVSMB24_37050 [Mucilaginibacter sp.]